MTACVETPQWAQDFPTIPGGSGRPGFYSGNRMQQEQEQEAWDKHSLKAVLRSKLPTVVKEAASVDFAAQTVQQGNRTRFANPAYEKKSSVWKAMYRAGKAPTVAALEFARGWLKEL